MPVLATIRRIPLSSPKGLLLAIPVEKAIIKNRRLETSLLLFPLPIVPHALSFSLYTSHDTKRPQWRR